HFFLYRPGDHRDLHSFPTRRSSDLRRRRQGHWWGERGGRNFQISIHRLSLRGLLASPPALRSLPGGAPEFRSDNRCRQKGQEPRSEEHTSELQSPCNLVCRLLLEKK